MTDAERIAELTKQRDEARTVADRWITAAARASLPTVAFDPMNPQGWMHAQSHAAVQLLDELKELRARSLSSESGTPDAKYAKLLAAKLVWFEEAAASDVVIHAKVDGVTLVHALHDLRHFLPSACHWAVNVAVGRLGLAAALEPSSASPPPVSAKDATPLENSDDLP